VVLATGVLVADQQGYRGTRSDALIEARENLYRIGFASLGNMTRGARPAAIELVLDIGSIQSQARRTAVHHAADGRAMRLAEVGNAKQSAKSTTGHDSTAGDTGAREKTRLSHSCCCLTGTPDALSGRWCRCR